jgi:hypothetical protein
MKPGLLKMVFRHLFCRALPLCPPPSALPTERRQVVMSVTEGSTGFTEELRREADPVFEAIFHHPFVRGAPDGT